MKSTRRFGAALILTASIACLGERPLGTTRDGSSGDGSRAPAGETAGTDVPSGSNAVPGSSGASEDSTTVPGGLAAGSAPAGDGAGGEVVATHLAFISLEALGYASRPLSAVAVRVQSADGTLVIDAEPRVTLALGNNPGAANLMGYLTATAEAGVAIFETVGLDREGTGYTLTASAAGLDEATSPPFDVVRLPFARVSVTGLSGAVSSLAITAENPPTLYAAGSSGVFRSDDGGSNWVVANFGNPAAVGEVLVDPLNPKRVYTTPRLGGTDNPGAGIYFTRSDDGGQAWRPLESLNVERQITSLAIDPVNPDILYAGATAGVFRSTDAGESWLLTSFPLSNHELAVDPATPTTLYGYAGDGDNFYRSLDSGTSWQLTTRPSARWGILSATPTGLFFGANRSTDGGTTWATPFQATSSPTSAFAYSPSNPQRLYVGMARTREDNGIDYSLQVSDNGGVSFGPPIAPPEGAYVFGALVVHPTNANRVFTVSTRGVLASSDGGSTWSNSSSGINTAGVSVVAMQPGTPNVVFVGGSNGVYRSADGGASWLHSQLGTGERVAALTIDPITSSTIYACALATTDPVFQYFTMFYRSDNGGATWSDGVNVSGPTDGCDVVASGETLWLRATNGLYRSIDGGVNWERLDLPYFVLDIASDPNGTTLYAGTSEGTYKSINAGQEWMPMTPDLYATFVVQPDQPSTVYMSLGFCGGTRPGGLRRSVDSGATWGLMLPSPCARRLVALESGRLLALTTEFPHSAVSTDQGASWQSGGVGILDQFLPLGFSDQARGQVADLTASVDGQTLYVATTIGLYKSVTGGL